MRYSFMTCPGREDYARILSNALPEAIIIMDTEKHATNNFLRMLASTEGHASILMEDDILLADDFKAKTQAVIEQRGEYLINFFSRRKRDLEIGSRFEPGATYNYNVCTYYPPGLALAIRDYYERWPRRIKELNGHGYDYLVADYLSENGMKYWLQVPSLVQHREGVSSIDKRRPRSRQSKTFI